MKVLGKMILIFFLVMNMTCCAKPSENIDQNLGGWVSNNDDTSNEDKDNSASNSSSKVIEVEKIEFNTDPFLSDIQVEIVEFLGDNIIFKVTNNSNNCYRFLNITAYFTCMPLANRRPLEDGEEYDNSYNFMNIPAYSTTYYLRHAFGEMMSTDKGGDTDGLVYYDFDPAYDSYRIELRGNEDRWNPSVLSDDLIQNASDYIVFDRSFYDSSTNKLGEITNKSNRPVEFNGFVVFMNGHVTEIQNGSELIDSTYEYLIPPRNQTYYAYKDKAYDCNSIYTSPFDFEGDIEHFDIYINSYFVDDVN